MLVNILTMEQNVLKNRVMRKVHTIYLLRRLLRPAMCRLYAVFLGTLALGSLVSIPDVLANMPHDAGTLELFFVDAFSKTDLVVQGMSLGLIVLFAWMAVDGVKTATTRLSVAHVHTS